MSAVAWPSVALGDVIEHRKEFITIDDLETYRRPRVQLHAQGIVLRDAVPGALIKTKKQQVVRAGEFLVAEIDAKVGGFGIVPEHLDGAIVSSHYFLYGHKPERLDNKYLGWFVKTPSFRQQVEAQGSTNYAAIRPHDVLGYEIPLPPLDEQRRIVARIDDLAAKVEEARGLRRQSLEEAQTVTSSYVTKIFSSLTDYPQVEISRLGLNGDNPIQIGPFGAQLHASEFVAEGIPVLNVGNVWPTGLRLDYLDHVTPHKAAALARYTIKPGDLLFARSGATLGKVCLVPSGCDDWLMTGHLFRVRFDTTVINNRFAFLGLRGARQIHDQVFGQVRGATRPGYNTTLLGAVRFPLPPLVEQRRIVAELDALQAKVDTVKALQAETAAELEAMLPAILDKAFKGEL